MSKKPAANLVADKVNEGVDVEIDGEKYTLVLTNQLIMQVENDTGEVLLTNPKLNLAMLPLRLLSSVFYHMLKRAGADISLDRCVDLASANVLAIQATIVSAWMRSMPSQEQVKILDPTLAAAIKEVLGKIHVAKDPRKPSRRSPGSTDTPSPVSTSG